MAIARYPNGQIPESVLHIFNRGRMVHTLRDGSKLVEDWYWGLTPGTYQKYRALVALAKRNTDRDLRLSAGFSCYRPLYGQVIARTLHGNGAARVGTSSHGGYWEEQNTLALDLGNWSWVYGGDRAKFYADCRAVGLTPGMIEPRRGYPDEPWHVIDLEPYRAVPAGWDAEPFAPEIPAKDKPKRRPDMGVVIERKDIPTKLTYLFTEGAVKHLPPEQIQEKLWEVGQAEPHHFDDNDFQRAIWNNLLEEYSVNDLEALAVPPGGRFLIASWADNRITRGAVNPEELAALIVSKLPVTEGGPTADEIALKVRAAFRADPLS